MTPPISMFTQDDAAMLNSPHEIRRHEISLSMPPQTFHNPYRPRIDMTPPISMFTQDDAAMLNSPHEIRRHEISLSTPPGVAREPGFSSASQARLSLGVVPAHNAAKIDAMGSTFLDILAANKINGRQYNLLCSTNKLDTGARNALIERLYHVTKGLTPEQYAVMRE